MIKRHACVGLIALCSFAPNIAAQDREPEAIPAYHQGMNYRQLYEYQDPMLQAIFAKNLRSNPSWKKLLTKKKMSISLVDMTDPLRPKYAAVNGEETLYAASMPKIAILLAAFQKIETGELRDTPSLRADLAAMIRVSSNAAATRSIDAVGGLDAVNAVLMDPRYGLYDETLGGGLWVGKRYAKTGRRVGDPLKNISHAASTMQVARFYYLLSTGRLVSQAASQDMLNILSEPGINHKFVASLNADTSKTDMYRKSGTWRTYHADSVLVWEPMGHRYILVGIVESPQGGQILKDVVAIAESSMGFNDE